MNEELETEIDAEVDEVTELPAAEPSPKAPMKLKESMGEKSIRIVSFIFCVALLFVSFISLFVPILSVRGAGISITPLKLMTSTAVQAMELGPLRPLEISFIVYKVFYYIFSAFLGIGFFLAFHAILTKKQNARAIMTNISAATVIFLFISMLCGFNYQNTYYTLDPSIPLSTNGIIWLIIGIVIFTLQFIFGIITGKKSIERKDEIKDTNLELSKAFALVVLTLATLFTPFYVFPGTPFRLSGIGILTAKNDPLSVLPMSGAYKSIMVIISIMAIISFVIALFLYAKMTTSFIQYNKINKIFGLTALILYALMGVNYMLVFVEGGAAKIIQGQGVMVTSMNTYSYLPLVLYILFTIGILFSKWSDQKLRIEYKIGGASLDESLLGGAPNRNSNVPSDEITVKLKKEKDEFGNILDPIPAFSELDNRESQYEADYQERMSRVFQEPTLPKLVHHIIEYAKYSRERLSYGPVEVKTFIAGIAASRLSILQGMSGTGKTSLPKIFMEAVDGFCEIVAVESSWRDKNELLGYYNEFTKKYTPKSFTQFLYKASLNKNIPYFIVLDEMNLSRIEYYFSDFLSLMEAREESRFIKLYDVQLYPRIDERNHYTMLRDGHTIDIPTNVWFIGTANRDESTFEISDKVYDRAQTMNFDKRAPKVNVTEQVNYAKKFMPYSELRRLFEETKSIIFDAENYEPIKKVEKLLRPYKISFGNRVLKQIEEFVKAYVACSDITGEADRAKFIHEAVDCIIFSKVVRKLELKQVTDIDTLIDEFAAIKFPKCEEFLQSMQDAAE